MKKNLKLVIYSLMSGMLIGGFIFGFTHCSGECDTIARFIIGMVFLILTPVFIGFPPVNEGGRDFFNVWPYIIVVGLMAFFYLKKKIK